MLESLLSDEHELLLVNSPNDNSALQYNCLLMFILSVATTIIVPSALFAYGGTIFYFLEGFILLVIGMWQIKYYGKHLIMVTCVSEKISVREGELHVENQLIGLVRHQFSCKISDIKKMTLADVSYSNLPLPFVKWKGSGAVVIIMTNRETRRLGLYGQDHDGTKRKSKEPSF